MQAKLHVIHIALMCCRAWHTVFGLKYHICQLFHESLNLVKSSFLQYLYLFLNISWISLFIAKQYSLHTTYYYFNLRIK